jgi:hypothetical protein
MWGYLHLLSAASLKTPFVLLTSIGCCFSKDTPRVTHIYCLLFHKIHSSCNSHLLSAASLKTPVVLLTYIVCCFSKDTRRVTHIYCLLLHKSHPSCYSYLLSAASLKKPVVCRRLYTWVTRRVSIEKQQTIDVSNTTRDVCEAADNRCE